MPFSDYQAKLERAIESKRVDRVTYEPRTSKADYLDYFKTQYGAKQGTRKAAEYLHSLGIVRNRQGEPVKVESLMRRFQSRGGKSQGETREVYHAAAANLPAKAVHHMVMPGQFTITVTGNQKEGDGSTRTRSFSVTFKGGNAAAFAANPSYQAFFYQRGYADDLIDMLDEGDYELEVTDVS